MIAEIFEEDQLGELLEVAKTNQETSMMMFKDQDSYIAWLMTAVFDRSYKVTGVYDGKLVGYTVVQLYKMYGEDLIYLHDLFMLKSHRGKGLSYSLILDFIKTAYESPAQSLKFSTDVLPQKYIDKVSKLAPLRSYRTYVIERTEEVEDFYKENFEGE